MKKVLFSLMALIVLSHSVEAALPPFYTTVAEYRALLDNQQLEEKLGAGQAIISIHRVDNGFEIVTPKYKLKVDIVYDKIERPGLAKFHLVFHDAEPQEE